MKAVSVKWRIKAVRALGTRTVGVAIEKKKEGNQNVCRKKTRREGARAWL